MSRLLKMPVGALLYAALLLLLSGGAALRAQGQNEEILVKLMEANSFQSLDAKFTQTRHSSLMQEDLVSEGRVCLLAPDKLRWEILSPYPSVKVFSGDEQDMGRFRIPEAKDFRVSGVNEEKRLIFIEPVRRDLKRLFNRITLRTDESLRIQEISIIAAGGDTTLLTFKDMKIDVPLDGALFKAPAQQ